MKFFSNLFLLGVLAMSFVMTGCDKTKPYDLTVPPALVHFIGGKSQIYSVINDPAPTYTLLVGTTDVTNVDRQVNFNVTASSGALEGTDFTINGGAGRSLVIPAGQTRAAIVISAVYAQYPFGASDTLVFTLSEPSVTPAKFLDTVRLIITGPSSCSEAVVNLNDLLGDYVNTNETFGTSPYGPYTTTISSATSTGPTSASIVVENIWDNGWGPITFNLDWADPANRTAIVVDQSAVPGSDAGDISSTYAGQTVAVKVPSATLSSTPGTYSYCDQVFTLKMQLGVTNLGYFNALYTVVMER
jgi:hypothetical protein